MKSQSVAAATLGSPYIEKAVATSGNNFDILKEAKSALESIL